MTGKCGLIHGPVDGVRFVCHGLPSQAVAHKTDSLSRIMYQAAVLGSRGHTWGTPYSSATGPEAAMSAHADRNLLFGVLALQMDFIRKDALIAALHAWVKDKSRPLGDVLVAQGALDAGTLALLDALVCKHLALHGDDAAASLAAVGSLDWVREELGRIADPDVPAGIGVAASARPDGTGPWATRTPATVGQQNTGFPSGNNRFRVLRPHAEGGLGKVLVALDEELGREVALKEIKDRQADDPESRARFLREAGITGALEHPGIVPVYGMGTYPDGRPYYAMRFIRGESLQQEIDHYHKRRNWDTSRLRENYKGSVFRRLLGRFIAACNAVAYAHSRGVIHRDLKPANIMLGKYGETLVVDWGLAKPIGRSAGGPEAAWDEPLLRALPAVDLGETLPGVALGTPAFMSPEQAVGDWDAVGVATDIYSLGATLYALLTGRPAVPGSDIADVLAKVRRGMIVPPRQVKPIVPRQLEAICLKAMARKPGDRYASAQELALDLERWLADEPVEAIRESGLSRIRRLGRRHRAIVTAIAGFAASLPLVALVILLSYGQYKQDQYKLAQNQGQLARALAGSGRPLEAEAAYRTALSNFEWLASRSPSAADCRQGLASCHHGLGWLLAGRGRRAEAEAALGRAIEVGERLATEFPTVPAYRAELSQVHHDLGFLLTGLGRTTEAAAAYRRAIALRETLAGGSAEATYRWNLAYSHYNLGLLLAGLGRRPEAEAAYRRAVALREKLADDYPDVADYSSAVAYCQHDLGDLLLQGGRLADAEAAFQRSVQVRQRLAVVHPGVPGYGQDLAKSRTGLAMTQARTVNHAKAAATAEALTGANGASAPTFYDSASILALASATAKDTAAVANRYATRAVALLRQSFVKGYPDVAHMLRDPTLDPLRHRDDYAALLWDLADTPSGKGK
jgi:serine/threonine-protein kinase